MNDTEPTGYPVRAFLRCGCWTVAQWHTFLKRSTESSRTLVCHIHGSQVVLLMPGVWTTQCVDCRYTVHHPAQDYAATRASVHANGRKHRVAMYQITPKTSDRNTVDWYSPSQDVGNNSAPEPEGSRHGSQGNRPDRNVRVARAG